ncbi:MAG: hypothetical protein ACEPOW_13400 [Bacteroidales bacterium]
MQINNNTISIISGSITSIVPITNMVNQNNAIFEVFVLGIIGGASGLIGKLIVEYILKKIKKWQNLTKH